MASIQKAKTIKSVIIVVLLLLVLVPPLYLSVFESPLLNSADEIGMRYVDDAFNRALVSFALARTTNAIISVIQDSEINIAPAGVGVTIAVGEALDPVNDMIERFSWVMLVSLVSLGMQKMLIEISPWFSIKLLLFPALLFILAGLWSGGRWRQTLTRFGTRLVFLAIVVRFCIPVVAAVNEEIYALFLDQHYTSAVNEIEHGNAALRKMDPMEHGSSDRKTDGIWDGVKKKAEQVGEMIDLQHRISRMKTRLTGMIENLLKMIAVFTLNTVVLPIGLLWLLAKLFRSITGSDSLLQIEQILTRRIAGTGPAESVSSEYVDPGGDGQDVKVDEKNEDIKADQ
ncbi:MAG: hypothetical protein C0623_00205 [Desulfuromonas sp.]|nr:MAG: hypothetical protein C0623_00205 [Desulfuromonas sp.]